MNAEPYSIRQQFGTRILPAKAAPPQTPYASYPEAYLARLLEQEAVAVRKRHGGMAQAPQTAASNAKAIETAAKKREWRIRTATAKVEAAYRDILAAMHGETTVIAIAEATGRTRQAVAVHLSNLQREGLVVSHYPHGTNRAAVWQRTEVKP
jgi:hypothetical protein